jgi:hypothetical protein
MTSGKIQWNCVHIKKNGRHTKTPTLFHSLHFRGSLAAHYGTESGRQTAVSSLTLFSTEEGRCNLLPFLSQVPNYQSYAVQFCYSLLFYHKLKFVYSFITRDCINC